MSSPRIFKDLVAPPEHGEDPVDVAESKKAAAEARAKGGYTAEIQGQEYVLPPQMINPMLDSIAKTHGGTTPNAADSAALRAALPAMIAAAVRRRRPSPGAVRPGPTQCHDITVYPAIGLAGGACGGYGLLLDIKDVANPKRIGAVADSNFSYWHSATFNNDGTKILFSDEWGGGGQPKCRATDKPEWGADAIFTLVDGKMVFQSYYKMPAAQTKFENCVAHNGSLIPIPGRDVMVQAWYQGGISVFDWTDPKNPTEIAFFDRGPVDSTKMGNGGSWSVYWYNGLMVSSEIARGLDIFELHAERVHLPERDRRGEVGAPRLLQRAGPAEDRLAAELCAVGGVPRPARAVRRPVRRARWKEAQKALASRQAPGGRGGEGCPPEAVAVARGRCRGGQGPGQGEDAGPVAEGPRGEELMRRLARVRASIHVAGGLPGADAGQAIFTSRRPA